VLVLLAAVVPTSVTRDVADTMVIALVIAVNTTLAVCQEIGADRAVAALARLVAPVVRVLCDDREVSRAVAVLLPEDLIVLAEGDLLPADSLPVGGASLQVHESALTGGSMAVDKSLIDDPGPGTGISSADDAGADRPGCGDGRLHFGTIVIHECGLARVTATGSRSELGHIEDVAPAGASHPAATPDDAAVSIPGSQCRGPVRAVDGHRPAQQRTIRADVADRRQARLRGGAGVPARCRHREPRACHRTETRKHSCARWCSAMTRPRYNLGHVVGRSDRDGAAAGGGGRRIHRRPAAGVLAIFKGATESLLEAGRVARPT